MDSSPVWSPAKSAARRKPGGKLPVLTQLKWFFGIGAPLILAMGSAGLLGGLIMPSRDMLVRAAAPPGAVGRTFGVVTSGFSMGGMVGPLLFGFIMDHHAPRWVFGASVVVMIIVALVALIGDCRAVRKRALAAAE